MKTLKLIAIVVLLSTFGCKKDPKDKNIIRGKITYVRWTGTEYTASGATVILYSGTGITGTKESTTTASLDGSYRFTDVKDGTHTVYSEGTYSTTYYYGQESISVAGEDDKTLDVKIK